MSQQMHRSLQIQLLRRLALPGNANEPAFKFIEITSAPIGRLFSTSPEGKPDFVYHAPFKTAVTRVKKLSLFSCACAVFGGPVILSLDAAATLSAKVSIAATLGGFGVFTTGLLHWFTKPYVHRLEYWQTGERVSLVSLNVLAVPQKIDFNLSEVQEPNTIHPLSTFAVRGRYYYIDGDNFGNDELFNKLAPHMKISDEHQAKQTDDTDDEDDVQQKLQRK